MQYIVPHFLETEQRILGPFTFTKLVIMLGVAGALWIFYYLLNFGVWLTLAIIAGSATLVLMFGSYYGRDLPSACIDAIKHFIRARRYTWQGVEQKESISEFIILKKEEVRKLPNVGEVKKEERPVGERVEEISRALDQR